MDRGREGIEGSDGTRTYTQPAEIHEAVSFEVLEANATPAGVEVVLGVGNEAESAVHIAGLRGEGVALLLDSEGFATPLRQADDTIEVPASSRVRATLVFRGERESAAQIRLWGREFALPEPASDPEPDSAME